MDAADLRQKSLDDLLDLRESLEDTSLLGKFRKDIARVEQILHERIADEDATSTKADVTAEEGSSEGVDAGDSPSAGGAEEGEDK
jgi:ribosomal protein L29